MKLDIQLFASGYVDNFSVVNNGSNAKMQGRIKWTAVAQGSAENYSLCTFELQAKRTDSLSSGTTTGAANWQGQVTVKDENNNLTPINFTTSSNMSINQTSWKTLKSVSNIKIYHNEDGTCTPTIAGYVIGPSITSFKNKKTSGSQVETFDTIPRGGVLSDIPEFDVDTGFIFNATKPVDTSYRKLVIKDGEKILNTIYEEDLVNGNIYVLSEDINVVYEIMKNDNEHTFSFELYSYTDNTMQIQLGVVSKKSGIGKINNANPVMNNFDYEDINEKIINLTGNNKRFILGYSLVKYIISEEDKGITNKGAIISEYLVKKNNEWISIKDLNYPINSEPFVITNNELGVRLVDSRQNVGEKLIITDSINNYVKPSFNNLIIQRDSGSNDVKINGNIKYWIGNYGLGENTLVNIQYRVKEKNGEYGNWLSLKNKVDVLNGNVNISDLSIYRDEEFNVFDLGIEYYVQLKVIDGIDEDKTFNEVIGVEFYIDDGRVLDSYYKSETGYKYSINGVVNPDLDDGLQVEGKIYLNGTELSSSGGGSCPFPIGFIYISIDSTNPETIFTGTKWERFANGRTLVGVNEEDDDFVSVGLEGGHKDIQTHNHTGKTNTDGAHYHTTTAFKANGDKSGVLLESWGTYGSTRNARIPYSGTNGTHNHAFTTDSYGEGDSGNLQPFITVFMWKRTE